MEEKEQPQQAARLPKDLAFGNIFVDLVNMHRDKERARRRGRRGSGFHTAHMRPDEWRQVLQLHFEFPRLLALNNCSPSTYPSFNQDFVFKTWWEI